MCSAWSGGLAQLAAMIKALNVRHDLAVGEGLQTGVELFRLFDHLPHIRTLRLFALQDPLHTQQTTTADLHALRMGQLFIHATDAQHKMGLLPEQIHQLFTFGAQLCISLAAHLTAATFCKAGMGTGAVLADNRLGKGAEDFFRHRCIIEKSSLRHTCRHRGSSGDNCYALRIHSTHKDMCMRNLSLLILFLLLPVTAVSGGDAPALSLANTYQTDIDLSEYWISEKLDGVRAYWDGKQLLTRQGNIIHAPTWFTAPLPVDLRLDGELWMGRGNFEQLSAIVRRQSPIDEQWRLLSYNIFDLPGLRQPFDQRVVTMKQLNFARQNPHISVLKQFRLNSHRQLLERLNSLVTEGAEGLMLHRGSAYYRSGRSDDLLKLKPYMDAEARVIKHYPGKGKYTGMMGSMLVEDAQGRQFRIGTGFSDAERRSPPAPGSLITYKYFGVTNRGIPRFASFLRLRQE